MAKNKTIEEAFFLEYLNYFYMIFSENITDMTNIDYNLDFAYILRTYVLNTVILFSCSV